MLAERLFLMGPPIPAHGISVRMLKASSRWSGSSADCYHFGKGADFELDANKNPHETGCLKLDSYKAKQQLGFSPRLDIDASLQWTANWVNEYINGTDMYSYTLKQIREFEDKNP